jgi:hypothetical protein
MAVPRPFRKVRRGKCHWLFIGVIVLFYRRTGIVKASNVLEAEAARRTFSSDSPGNSLIDMQFHVRARSNNLPVDFDFANHALIGKLRFWSESLNPQAPQSVADAIEYARYAAKVRPSFL